MDLSPYKNIGDWSERISLRPAYKKFQEMDATLIHRETIMLENKKTFIEKIKKTLTDHGFPDRKVTLPLEKMYQIADEKNLNFNDILNELDNQGIAHTKTSEKILFYSSVKSVKEENQSDLHQEEALYGKLFDRFKGMDPKEMMKNPHLILEKMTPEELQDMQEMYQKMSPSDRDQLMKKAKDMGIE